MMISSAAHTPAIRTEIRLFDDERKIQIWNHVEKDAVEAPEGVYFAFPFAATPARIRYESLNTWIDPEKNQLPGANKEWFSAQHWVSVSSPKADHRAHPGRGAAVDAGRYQPRFVAENAEDPERFGVLVHHGQLRRRR